MYEMHVGPIEMSLEGEPPELQELASSYRPPVCWERGKGLQGDTPKWGCLFLAVMCAMKKLFLTTATLRQLPKEDIYKLDQVGTHCVYLFSTLSTQTRTSSTQAVFSRLVSSITITCIDSLSFPFILLHIIRSSCWVSEAKRSPRRSSLASRSVTVVSTATSC